MSAMDLPYLVDLTPYTEVTIKCGMEYVTTTPEHFVDCMLWLLANVDTNTVITKYGVEEE